MLGRSFHDGKVVDDLTCSRFAPSAINASGVSISHDVHYYNAVVMVLHAAGRMTLHARQNVTRCACFISPCGEMRESEKNLPV